jgi:hypothetical protein
MMADVSSINVEDRDFGTQKCFFDEITTDNNIAIIRDCQSLISWQ